MDALSEDELGQELSSTWTAHSAFPPIRAGAQGGPTIGSRTAVAVAITGVSGQAAVPDTT